MGVTEGVVGVCRLIYVCVATYTPVYMQMVVIQRETEMLQGKLGRARSASPLATERSEAVFLVYVVKEVASFLQLVVPMITLVILMSFP